MIAPGSYCDLHVHSCFSLGDGVSPPDALIDRAAALGIPALALTDHDNLYGIVPFFQRALEQGIHPIVGCELTLEDASHLTLLAENNVGYSNLCRVISIAQANAPKGSAALPWAVLEAHAEGLICLTGCRQGLLARRVLAHDLPGARATLTRLIALFGRANVYVELQRRQHFGDERLTQRLAALADEQGLPYVATSNAHYLDSADAEVRAVLVSVQQRLPIPEDEALRRDNYEACLRSPNDMRALFDDLPLAITRTAEIAARCRVTLPRGFTLTPTYPIPQGKTAGEYLRQLCEAQLPLLYPSAPAQAKAQAQLDKELDIIDQLGLHDFFLIAWDIGRFCRRHRIWFHVRGSGAGSVTTCALGLSRIDPLTGGIVVERFISLNRTGTPDLDFDIDYRERERVLRYTRHRYGSQNAAMIATYITYKTKSALRDVSFALGIPPHTLKAAWQAQQDGEPVDAHWTQPLALVQRLKGIPHHLGQHPGGMVLTGSPISSVYPVEPARMAGRTVLQMDKESVEDQLILKQDLLGSRALKASSDAARAIFERTGKRIDLFNIPYDDPKVYDLICSCRTIGLFQLGTGAEIRILPAMQPRCIDDLKIQISLVRPGPVVAQMLKPYLRRRQGEPWVYLHPLLKRALAPTLGVIVFQDQVILIVQDVGGFSPGRAELVRKALGKKNAQRAVAAFKAEFLAGALKRGVAPAIAEQIWELIASFANYSFCEAHARAYAQLAYATAWFRCYYPLEFWYGLLRNVPLGSYPARVLEGEARRSGTRFLPFDINRSQATPTLEGSAIRHGLGYVRGISEDKANAIVAARGDQPFRSLVDVIARTKLPRRTLEALILAGALDRFGERKQLLWDLAEALDLARRPPTLPLTIPDERVHLPPMTPDEKTLATLGATGVTVDRHITDLKRDAFERAGCQRLSQLQRLPLGTRVRVGGIMADGLRTPPTAKGTGFMRLEQSEGMVDVTTPAALLADRTTRKALRHAFLVIDGILRQTGQVVSVTALAVSPLEDFRVAKPHHEIHPTTTPQRPVRANGAKERLA